MRVGVINVANLTRARETFKPRWRTVFTIIFLFSVFFWWAAVHQLKSLAPLVDDEALRTRTLILAAITLPPLTVALFRRDDFARLFFVLALILNTVTATLLLLYLVARLALSVSSWDGNAVSVALIGALFFLAVYDQYLVGSCYVLFRSLMPFGRWKAYRQQVIYALRLWSGQWKGVEGVREAGEGQERYHNSGTPYRLTPGWLSFAVGTAFLVVALFSTVNGELLPAICRLELSRVWDMLRHVQTTLPMEPSATAGSALRQMTSSVIALLIACSFFFVFGYFWTQWRRENVPIHRVPLLQHMTSSDLLLLRSFSDDVKYVSRKNGILTGIFRLSGWSFTFEQLIVNCLKYLGPVRLIDM